LGMGDIHNADERAEHGSRTAEISRSHRSPSRTDVRDRT
jgi:hypothetical protein